MGKADGVPMRAVMLGLVLAEGRCVGSHRDKHALDPLEPHFAQL